MRKATSNATIGKLDDFIAKLGKPQKVLTDRGTQFTSKKWKKALKERNIKMILTSIRHPRANMVERVNRELSRFFRTFLQTDKHDSWFKWLEEIETILNESYHDTIEITPYEALLGKRPMRLWEKRIVQTLSNNIQDRSEIIRMIRDKIRTKCERRNERINKIKMGLTFRPGEQVLVKACNVPSSSSLNGFLFYEQMAGTITWG